MVLTAALGLAATAYVALRTARGLRLDAEAMNAVGSPQLALYRLHEGLTWVSVGSVALSLLACVALALVRSRFDLALGAVVIIGGSNVTTQILKYHVIGPISARGRTACPADTRPSRSPSRWRRSSSPRRHGGSAHAPHVSVHLGALIGASAVGGLLVLWGVRPQAGMRDLGLGLISLGAIGLACAVSVAAVARVADRHLG